MDGGGTDSDGGVRRAVSLCWCGELLEGGVNSEERG